MGKGGAIQQMGMAAANIAASPIKKADEKVFDRLSHRFIHMRCNDASIITLSTMCGTIAIFLLGLSLTTEHWLHTIEPRPINVTLDDKANLHVLFKYESGYWWMCRERYVAPNENLTEERKQQFSSYSVQEDFKLICIANTMFTESEEMSKLSKATAAIMNRIPICSLIHIMSLIFTTIATVFSVIGFLRKDKKTLYAAISFIVGGLAACVAVMQYICIVDDEMSPRMKPTAGGEPSQYHFSYGFSFLAAALSFLETQVCALSQLVLFFRRYPGLEGKMEIIPGLKEKVRRAKMERELGLLTPTTPRKNPPTHPDGSPARFGHNTPRHTAMDTEFTFDAKQEKWDFADAL